MGDVAWRSNLTHICHSERAGAHVRGDGHEAQPHPPSPESRQHTPHTTRTHATASVLAHKYGVTGKAIRDVWTHKTWACATRPFWPAADDSDGAVAPAEKKRKKHD